MQTTLCTENELASRQKILEETAGEFDKLNATLVAEIQNVGKDFCNDSATEEDRQEVFNAFNNNYAKISGKLVGFINEFAKFGTNVVSDIKGMSPEKFLESVKDYEQKLDELYTRSFEFKTSDFSFDGV